MPLPTVSGIPVNVDVDGNAHVFWQVDEHSFNLLYS